MVSIKDVARLSGVSISTVSRALNGYSDVKENTRKRIIEVATNLGYRPSQSARNLSSKRKENVAVIISGLASNSPMDEFTGNVLRGLNTYLQGKDMTIAMYGISSEMQKNRSLEDFCREYSLSGVILAGLKLGDPYLEEVKNIDIPCVGIDIKLEGSMVSSILTNDTEAFREITEYVIEKGYTNLVLVKGKEEAGVTVDRLAGFKQACENKNIDINSIDILEGKFNEELVYKNTKNYIKKYKKSRGRAFICMSDLMAIAVLRAIEELGYEVNKDFFVSGFDGIHLLNYIKPNIATVDQNMRKKGYEGMRLLMRVMKNLEEPRTIYIQHSLIKEK